MRYDIDSSTSEISFIITTSEIGNFKNFNGEMHVDDDITNIIINIDPKSINTNNSIRDSYLKSEHFFNVDKFSKITFISNQYIHFEELSNIVGYLTIKGQTNEVILDVKYHGKTIDSSGKERIGYSIKAKINKKDFDLIDSIDEIDVNFEIQFVKTEEC